VKQAEILRRRFLAGLPAAASGWPGFGLGPRAEARRPNILLIMADDLGFSDLGCYGSEIRTPNLDRMAREGMCFTQFYNAVVCCPTRASLMTGLYAHQVGIGDMMANHHRPGYRGDLGRNCVTIAEALRAAGYRTAISGKWHLTPASAESKHNWPLQRGFDRFFGTLWGGGNFYNPAWLVRDNALIQPESRNFYYTDAITDNAIGFLDQFAGERSPFFLYVAYTAPHWPLHAPDDLAVPYDKTYRTGWDELRQRRYRRQLDLGIIQKSWALSPRDPRVPSWESTPHRDWQVRRMAVYAAQVERMDYGIGQILARLRALRIEQDTLIMFLSDNGGGDAELGLVVNQPAARVTRDGRPIRVGNNPQIMPGPDDTYQSYGVGWANLSNTPFRLYKTFTHEGGMSTPLIARWPGVIRPGVRTDHLGHVIDVMPTCLQLASSGYPERFQGREVLPLEGRSLAHIIRGERHEAEDRAVFWEYAGHRAVRQGKWKLVANDREAWSLYDMEADRPEMNDLAVRYPGKVQALTRSYDGWAQRCNVVPRAELLGKPAESAVP